MHFGPTKKRSSWLLPPLACIAFCLTFCFGCKDKSEPSFTFATPSQGQNYNIGEVISLQIDTPKDVQFDEVTYLVDRKSFGVFRHNQVVSLPTKDLKLGYRIITAIVKHGNKKDTLTTNIVLRTNQKPVQLSYQLVNSFPHDTSAFTEGLAYIDGRLLESTGEKGASKLKWVDLKSGKTLQETSLAPQYFGEGSLKIGDKIIMLTYQENTGFIFDAKTFKQIGTFPYGVSREGWGLAFDGKHILSTDGTNRIWLMNAETYKEEDFIEVYDHKGPLERLNELEYIDGKIYANVWLTNKIVRIDPVTGSVEAEIDLSALVPKHYLKGSKEEQENVLNGIAWDAKGKRLFVTGKKWPKLYEIKLLGNN